MANVKFSELTVAGALTGAEVVPILQDGTNVITTTQEISDLGRIKTIVSPANDFTLDGNSGTVYTNTGAGGHITFTLPDSATGTEYTITNDPNEENTIGLLTVGGISAVVGSTGITITDSILGGVDTGSSVTFLKITATQWIATSIAGNIFLD